MKLRWVDLMSLTHCLQPWGGRWGKWSFPVRSSVRSWPDLTDCYSSRNQEETQFVCVPILTYFYSVPLFITCQWEPVAIDLSLQSPLPSPGVERGAESRKSGLSFNIVIASQCQSRLVLQAVILLPCSHVLLLGLNMGWEVYIPSLELVFVLLWKASIS